MASITRRDFLYLLGMASATFPFHHAVSYAADAGRSGPTRYPITVETLTDACRSELTACRNYNAFAEKALSEKYHNIAYLFSSLSVSERIHADNYRNLLNTLGVKLRDEVSEIVPEDTKSNLRTAAENELLKIEKYYPEVVSKLLEESLDKAVIYCMYSWKSHRQHEAIIRDIRKYSGFFFGALSRKIESMNPNYYVCRICGSTVDEKPEAPCEICNYPPTHYTHLKRPGTSS